LWLLEFINPVRDRHCDYPRHQKAMIATHHLTDQITGRSKQQSWVETVTHKGTVVVFSIVPCSSHSFWTCYSVILMVSVCSFLPWSCCFFRQLISVHNIHLACMGLQHAIMTIPLVGRSVEGWHLSYTVSCLPCTLSSFVLYKLFQLIFLIWYHSFGDFKSKTYSLGASPSW
jgi:hypothetical protein